MCKLFDMNDPTTVQNKMDNVLVGTKDLSTPWLE